LATLGWEFNKLAGLEHLFDIDSGVQTQVLIAGVTAIATVSVVLGVDKGLEF
jgi:choline/glycine/proline betaine transport protein